MTSLRDPISTKGAYNFIITADICMVCCSCTDALAVRQMDTVS